MHSCHLCSAISYQPGGGFILLSIRDADILRLLKICRFIPGSLLTNIFSQREIDNLCSAGLVRLNRDYDAYILTAQGVRFHDNEITTESISASRNSYRENSVFRRLYISKIVLTAYRAGINVFTSDIEDMQISPSLYLPSNYRGRSSNRWANSRISAIASIGDLICSIHHVHRDVGQIILSDEVSVFTRNTARLSHTKPAFILAGDSYAEVLHELEKSSDTSSASNALTTYGEAYLRLRMPVYLLSCNETGAMQLLIMSQSDYRTRLTRTVLKSQYRPPPEDMPNCDALFEGVPFLLAVDMDLRRIDAAIELARKRGFCTVSLAALSEQVKTVFAARYRDTGKARVFELTQSALDEFLGTKSLYHPPRKQFHNAKGDVVDAPPVKTHRKA